MRRRHMGRLVALTLALGVPGAVQAAAPDASLGATAEGLVSAGRTLSPQLREAALETAAASAGADAAGTLPDPSLSENYQYYQSGGLFSMNFITISQTFPLWGKLGLQHQAALAEVDAARGRERAAQDQLDEQLKAAFARYYAFTKALAVNRDIAGLATQMSKAAQARYSQGAGGEADVIQVLQEATAIATEAARLDGERRSAMASINALLARPADAPLAEPLRLRPLPGVEPTIASLLERARGSNPTLSASAAEIRAARSQRDLAGKAWYPDISVGGGPIVQTNAPTGFSAIVSLNIPLQWGAKTADERQAIARLGAAQQKLAASTADIEGALGQALAQFDTARRIEMLLRGDAMRQARAGFRAALAGYGQGRGDLTTALAAEHRVHDTQLELLRTETDEQTALATIERLIGGEL